MINGCDRVALELIQHFNVDINEADEGGFTTLMYAILYSSPHVDILMNHPTIDLFQINANGHNAAQYAKSIGFNHYVGEIEQAQKMATLRAYRFNSASYFYRTPLDLMQFYFIPMINDIRNNPTP